MLLPRTFTLIGLLSLLAQTLVAGEKPVKPWLTPEPPVQVKLLDREASRLVEGKWAFAPPWGAEKWPLIPDAPIRREAQVIGDTRFFCPHFVAGIGTSPDGKWLVYGVNHGYQAPIWVYERESGRVAFRLWGHQRVVEKLVFSPDSKRLYSGAGGQCRINSAFGDALHVWDFAKRKLLAVFPSKVWALTPDGRILVTVERVHVPSQSFVYVSRPVVRVRDTSTWKSLGDYAINEFDPSAVAVSPDGNVIALGSGSQGMIRLWDRKAGKELASLSNISESVSAMAFSADGRTLCATGLRVFGANRPEPVYLWDWSADKVVHRFDGHEGRMITAQFSPDGKYLVSTDKGLHVIVWDVSTGKMVAQRERLTNNPAFLPTKAGLRLIFPSGQPGPPPLVSFPDLKDVEWEGNLRPGPATVPFETVAALPLKNSRYSFRPVRRLPLGTTIRPIKPGTESDVQSGIGLYDERGKRIRCFEKNRYVSYDVDPKGKYLLAYSLGKNEKTRVPTLRLWHISSGKVVHLFRYYPVVKSLLRFSPNGTHFAIWHTDEFIRLWDLESLKPVLALDTRWYPRGGMTFSKDGRKLVVGNQREPVVSVWDLTIEKKE